MIMSVTLNTIVVLSSNSLLHYWCRCNISPEFSAFYSCSRFSPFLYQYFYSALISRFTQHHCSVSKCNFFFFVCKGLAVITPNYGSMNRCEFTQLILGMRVDKNTVVFNTQPVNTWRCIVRVVKYMYKKTYLSFRIITSRPLCQISKGVKQLVKSVLKWTGYINWLSVIFLNVY